MGFLDLEWDLSVPQFKVVSICVLYQVFVFSTLDNLSLVDDEYHISVFDCAQSVGYGDAGNVNLSPLKCILNYLQMQQSKWSL